MSRVDEILNFWFGSPDESGYGKLRRVWFTKDEEFDEKVRSYFLPDYRSHWSAIETTKASNSSFEKASKFPKRASNSLIIEAAGWFWGTDSLGINLAKI